MTTVCQEVLVTLEGVVGKDEALVAPETMYVTHIFDGENVVRGGMDGQTWVATFASENAAEHFVRYAVENEKTFTGLRR